MRGFFGLIILIVFFLVVDAVFLGGHYSDALWRDAKYQGESFNEAIHAQLHKLGL